MYPSIEPPVALFSRAATLCRIRTALLRSLGMCLAALSGLLLLHCDLAAAVPSGWASADIGAPALSGSASWTAATGIWTLNGAGTDIWGTGDQCNFTSRATNGDVTIVAHVSSVSNTDPYAKAGVMIRKDATGGAACASVLVSYSKGITFQWRNADGATTNAIAAAGAIKAPAWVRLTRAGNLFSGAYSYDGINWLQLGDPQTVTMTSVAKAGVCATSQESRSDHGLCERLANARTRRFLPRIRGAGVTRLLPNKQPLLVWSAAIGILRNIGIVCNGPSFHIHGLCAVPVHDLPVAAPDVCDRPMLIGSTVGREL